MLSARNHWIAVAVLATLLGPLSAAPSRAASVVVTTLSTDLWFNLNEGPAGSVGDTTFVPGPATPPAGNGSAMLEVDDTGRASFGTELYKGTALASITQMTFSSYASSAETVVNPALQFDIDYDGTDMSTAYQGRLTFEPAGAPTPDTWVSQDALAGNWWASQAPGNGVCPQSTPCTWAQVLAAFPNAAIRNDSVGGGALLFRLGGPIAGGAIANVDDFTITVSSSSTTYDFEPGASENPSVGSAGSIIAITAYGFSPNRTVRAFYYTNASPRRVKLCQALSSATGSFYCAVAIPTAPVSGPSGVHIIRVKGPRRLDYRTSFVLTP